MAKIQTKEVAVIDFEKFSVAQLPELQGKKEEIKGIIEANPVVDVVDNSTYELAKKSRTAVKTLRTGLEKEQKDVKKKIKEHVLDVVDAEYDMLVLGVRNQEIIRQEPITAWEDKKEQERLEKVRLEELRVKQIKEAIQNFKDTLIDNVNDLIFEGVSGFNEMFERYSSEFDRSKLAEFEVLFDDALLVIRQLADSKIKTLTEQEEIRLEQIRLAEERKKQEEEAKKIAEAQRVEREKFEAEQKAIAEKQRIAKEQFEKEKTEFEAKQKKAKIDDRNKNLKALNVDLASLLPVIGISKHSLFVNALNNFPDDAYEIELKEFLEFIKPKEEVLEVDEIAQESKLTEGFSSKEQIRVHDEEDVHEVAAAKPIEKQSVFDVSKIENQIWNNIYDEWNLVSDKYPDAFEYLKEFYHSPKKKD